MPAAHTVGGQQQLAAASTLVPSFLQKKTNAPAQALEQHRVVVSPRDREQRSAVGRPRDGAAPRRLGVDLAPHRALGLLLARRRVPHAERAVGERRGDVRAVRVDGDRADEAAGGDLADDLGLARAGRDAAELDEAVVAGGGEEALAAERGAAAGQREAARRREQVEVGRRVELFSICCVVVGRG